MTTTADTSDAQPPDTITRAVHLMMVGAALALLLGIAAAATDIHRPAVAAAGLLTGTIVAAIWWLVARTCRQGRTAGRILATAFFGLATLGDLTAIQHLNHVDHPALFALDTLSWLVGLGTIVRLWHRDSSTFFESRRPYPRTH